MSKVDLKKCIVNKFYKLEIYDSIEEKIEVIFAKCISKTKEKVKFSAPFIMKGEFTNDGNCPDFPHSFVTKVENSQPMLQINISKPKLINLINKCFKEANEPLNLLEIQNNIVNSLMELEKIEK